jgi:hypothetical protein
MVGFNLVMFETYVKHILALIKHPKELVCKVSDQLDLILVSFGL